MSSLLRAAQVYLDRIASLEPDTPLEIESSDDLDLKAGSGKDINYVTTGGGAHRFEGEAVHADAVTHDAPVTHEGPVTFGEAQMPVPAGDAPIGLCRAWARWAHGGFIGTPFNFSGFTAHGSAEYTFTFATPMPDANYAVMGINDGNRGLCIISQSATEFRVRSMTGGSSTSNHSPSNASILVVR